MSNIIEDFYYGNIEPQEVNSELTPKLKKKLSNLAEKEEQLTARLTGEDKELFQSYVSAYIEFFVNVLVHIHYNDICTFHSNPSVCHISIIYR